MKADTKLYAITQLIKNAREQVEQYKNFRDDELALYLYIELGVIYEIITNENHNAMRKEVNS